MKIAFYGSSLLSSYWNGAATYYRGLLRALSALGHDIAFYEPDVYDRSRHRDMDPPEWCKVIVYPGTVDALVSAARQATEADVVVKASGVGFEDERLLALLRSYARADATTIFWDVDAPATLAELGANADHPLRRALPALDAVLTYGGGDPVVSTYRRLGANRCVPIYNALDPATHFPSAPQPRFAAILGFLGNRLPDREERVERFFFDAAARMHDADFLLGGSGWDARTLPPNVRYVGHVGTADHNAFNCSTRAVLNISRADMARTGYSPATRVFEAAGAGACIITDAWEGIEQFLEPGSEVLVARDGREVAEIAGTLTSETATAIGRQARERVLRNHTYEHRAAEVDELLRQLRGHRREAAA